LIIKKKEDIMRFRRINSFGYRAVTALLVVVSLTAFGSALFAQQQSEPKYEVVMEKIEMPMRDGTILRGDMYRPEAEGKFPVLIERTPYDRTREVYIEDGTFFAERGYIYIAQSCRGLYESDGIFYPFLDDGWNEHRDGFDSVQWLAKQPWSNGKVAVTGGSHTGQTTYLVGPTQPSELVALFARESASDLHGHWVYRGGAFELAWIHRWVAWAWGMPSIQKYMTGQEKERVTGAFVAYNQNQANWDWYLPVNKFPPFKMIPQLQFFFDWVEHPDDGPYWWQQNVGMRNHLFTVPVYHLGGWYDVFLPGTYSNYMGIRDKGATELARKSQKLVIGPWIHGPTNVGMVKVRDLEFPGADRLPDGSEFNYSTARLRWFDYWVKGIDNGVMDEPPVLIYVMGDNKWRYEKEWPLARAKYTNYYFHSQKSDTIDSLNDGSLSARLPGEAPRMDSFRYDPNDPIPTLGGHTIFWPNGPCDHRTVDVRSLTYTSEVLTEDLEVTGPVKCVLYGMSTAVDTDWCVRLSDVYPDGRSINIIDGILRARYRNSFTKPELMEPGRIYKFEIDLWATSNVFKAGHRLRVAVQSSNFPQYTRNLNTAESPETGSKPEIAFNFVSCDKMWPSHIVLPVIPR
jgi:putative CocE/NonD family hydrolase